MNNQNKISVYCDGGASPNPGKTGSGIAIYHNNELFQLWYGLYEENGTNNTAELNALYYSLLIAKKQSAKGFEVKIFCDSMYSINCITTWAKSWVKNGWKKKGGEIKNLEIIKISYYLYQEIKNTISISHIKAHMGIEGNELADRMTIYARKRKEKNFVKYEDAISIDEILKIMV